MDILLCLYSDTGYFLEPLAETGLSGRFVSHDGRLLFRVEAPAALVGQLLCCHASGRAQRRFLGKAARHNARFRVMGFALGRRFYATSLSLARMRSF